MKDDTLKKIMSYFFKYLWLLGCVLICINFGGMMVTAYDIMKTAAQQSLTSLATELKSRVYLSYQLLEGISGMPDSGNLSIPLADRAYKLKPFADSFGYWMIGTVDLDGSIASTRRYGTAKVERDYIPRIMRTQKREMTEVFPSGATGDLNVTQLVPVIRNSKVVSIVFTSVRLTELNGIISRPDNTTNGYYVLVDNTGSIIAHHDGQRILKNVNTLNKTETMLFGSTNKEFLDNIVEYKTGSFISWFAGTLIYTTYTPLQDTNWTLIYRIRMLPTFKASLIGFSVQAALYVLVFSLMCYYGTLYMQRELQPVDNILKQVIDLNREILNATQIDTDEVSEIIRISHRGLKDELTGLPTRMLFRQILNARMQKTTTPHLSAIFFIDMDNLKTINDSFGHSYGDDALRLFGNRLQGVASRFSGLCARYGGDEFLLFVEGLEEEDSIKPIAEELLHELSGKIVKEGVEHSFHSSIGIALYPLHSTHIDVVIQLADIALYETKQRGKNGYTVYSTRIAKKREQVLEMLFSL